MNTKVSPLPPHRIASHDDWLAARLALLRREKELTRLRAQVAGELRALPWESTKKYVFEGPHGKVEIGDLFGRRRQLIVYHFMLGADWDEGCKSCSYIADHIDATLPHLHARDTSLVVVSHAPYAVIQPFHKRMGWKFPWVSSAGSEFNRDFQVSYTESEIEAGGVPYNYTTMDFPHTEAPGLSVFAQRPDGKVFHTYSRYGRGLEDLMGAYTYLDFTPKGRDEEKLESPMEWVRHHDKYDAVPEGPIAAR
jgi:predicted dithiol-disulfide oxidoreductase (DUF899 family)